MTARTWLSSVTQAVLDREARMASRLAAAAKAPKPEPVAETPKPKKPRKRKRAAK